MGIPICSYTKWQRGISPLREHDFHVESPLQENVHIRRTRMLIRNTNPNRKQDSLSGTPILNENTNSCIYKIAMWHFILIRARFLCRITFRCACPHKEDQNPYWEYQSLSGIPISNGNTNLFICKMGRLHFTFTRT